MQRALVTGGAGFIGSNLVDRLLELGTEVDVLDDVSTGRRENLEAAIANGARLHEADVRDAAAVDAVISDTAPDAVFHLAAQVDVRRSVEDPAADTRINVEGTINVLEACRRAGVRRLVYSSTGGALYGETPGGPAPETTAIEPLAPYGLSKSGGEAACGLYRRLHGVATISLRYANVYGPRQNPLGEGGVVAIFCERARRGAPVTVYGDGRQTRDFVHVRDVVEANLRAAESGRGGAYNVATGEATSVLDLVARLSELLGRPVPTRHAAARLGEITHSRLDPSRARADLGWQAAVPLADGLRALL